MSALAIHPSPVARKLRDRRPHGPACGHQGSGPGPCRPVRARVVGAAPPIEATNAQLLAFPLTDATAPSVTEPLAPARPADRSPQRAEVAAEGTPGGSGAVSPARPVRVVRAAGTTGRMRLTTRGRRVLVALGFAVSIAVGGGAGALVYQSAPEPVDRVDTVVVQPGESLWVIASGVTDPGQDVREVVDQIKRLNGLQGAAVHAGQELAVPVD